MQFEHLIPGRFIDLERFTDVHIPELESIAMDEKIWQNLPYNIKGKASSTFLYGVLSPRSPRLPGLL